jgi:hypothetical protein
MIVKRAAIFMGNAFGETHFFGIFSKMTNVSQIFWGGRLTRGKKTWYD